MYDVAIIGSGPAGVSAALNLKLLNKRFIWLSSRTSSKKVDKAELIKNYPGLPDITGKQLNWTFLNHVESMGIEIREDMVTGVYDMEGSFTLLVKDEQIEAKSIILCLGVETAKPIIGEDEYVGRGISYCATCDGFLYKDKTIAVYCTDKKFEHEIEYLCSIAGKAYVIPLYPDYSIKSPKAEIVLKRPVKFSGDMRLKKLEFKDSSLDIDGAFILRGALSPSTLLRGIKVEDGHIAVNRDMSTNIKGVFAAGDCTGRPYQYAKAVGEGNVAAHSAVEYLANL